MGLMVAVLARVEPLQVCVSGCTLVSCLRFEGRTLVECREQDVNNLSSYVGCSFPEVTGL